MGLDSPIQDPQTSGSFTVGINFMCIESIDEPGFLVDNDFDQLQLH
jgi:hypothetical protein